VDVDEVANRCAIEQRDDLAAGELVRPGRAHGSADDLCGGG
jgi:hypothetical protein